MARGKHGAIAERKHVDETTYTELHALRRRNAELVRDLAEAKDRLRTEQQTRAKETRRLRAERDEGSAPMLEAAEEQLRREKVKVQQARAALRRIEKTDDRHFRWFLDHLISDHGLTRIEAIELMMDEASGLGPVTLDVERGHVRGISGSDDPEMVRSVQRSQLKRH